MEYYLPLQKQGKSVIYDSIVFCCFDKKKKSCPNATYGVKGIYFISQFQVTVLHSREVKAETSNS